jgi:hypothetical protein
MLAQVIGAAGQQAFNDLPAEEKGTRNTPATVGYSTNDLASAVNGQRKLVRTDNGTLHAVWETEGEIFYAFSLNNGQNWSVPVNISRSGSYESFPGIATNGTNLYIAWVRHSGSQDSLRFRRFVGSSGVWEPPLDQTPMTVASAWNYFYNKPSVATYDNNVYIVCERLYGGNDWEIVLYRHANYGQSWGWNSYAVTGNSVDDRNPSASAVGTIVYVVYQRYTGSTWQVRFTRSGSAGTSWGGDIAISSPAGVARNPTITNNGTRIFTTWEMNETAKWNIQYRYSPDDAATWEPPVASEPINITSGTTNPRHPTIVHEDNTTYLLWHDTVPPLNDNIYLSVNSTGTWSTPADLTRCGDTLRFPNAFINVTQNRLDFIYTRLNETSDDEVLYDFYSTISVHPALEWTGEQNYVTDGLDPEGNTTGHLYTYRVRYIDADDDAPKDGYPQIWIDRNLDGMYGDNEKYSMDEANSSDVDYTDGKLYAYSTTFDDVGTYKYRFQARDSQNAWATGPPTSDHTGPVITDFNFPPELAWTEEKGYELDGLEPEGGYTTDNFSFRIKYIDLLNEPPASGFPKALFDMNRDGDFEDPEDETGNMTEETPEDVTYDNGKIYIYSRNFSEEGIYNYMFKVEDLVGLKAETESRAGPNVTIDTAKPVLNWTGEPEYLDDGLDPEIGSIYTDFEYRIRYSDADNDTPAAGYPKVWVDLDMNGMKNASEWFDMVELDSGNTDFVGGKIYHYNTTLPSEGKYNYTFSARDFNNAEAVGDPVTSIINKPEVRVNNHPVLSWTGEAGYGSDGLEPEEGETNSTEFVYRVKYIDPDDEAPVTGYPRVWIDHDLDGEMDGSEEHLMEDVNPSDVVFTDGKLYTYTTTLELVGTHSYCFIARDSLDFAKGDPTIPKQGPTTTQGYMNNPPVLEYLGVLPYVDKGVDPMAGSTQTEFTYKAKYFDAEGDKPDDNYPNVWIDMNRDGNQTPDEEFAMNESDYQDSNVMDGKEYWYSTSFPEIGEYSYRFLANDLNGTAAIGPATAVKTGPNITSTNTPPALAWLGIGGFFDDGVHPDSGFAGNLFTFGVDYYDIDNDPPAPGFPKLWIDLNLDGDYDDFGETKSMFVEWPLDMNYTDGKTYSMTLFLNRTGTYQYTFRAYDMEGDPATGDPTLNMTGPEVKEVVVPNQPELMFVGSAGYEFDGVEPPSGKVGDDFKFRIMYLDLDGDMPMNGSMKMLIDVNADGDFDDGGEVVIMQEEDPGDADVTNGKIYSHAMKLETGEHRYRFEVTNTANETAKLGPLTGPYVAEDKPMDGEASTTESALPSMLWLLIIILVIVICLAGGYAAGRRKGPEPEELDEEPAEEPPYMEPPVRESEVPPMEEPVEPGGGNDEPEDEIPVTEEPPVEEEPPTEPETSEAEETPPTEEAEDPDKIEKDELDDLLESLTEEEEIPKEGEK